MGGEGRVREFIRDSLGCGCDEEVFRHIEHERNVCRGGVMLRSRINVGNRLLVYVVEAGKDAISQLPLLVKAGREERDTLGLNRFRLVLLSDDKGLKKAALKAFNALSAVDDRVHLHILKKDETTDI